MTSLTGATHRQRRNKGLALLLVGGAFSASPALAQAPAPTGLSPYEARGLAFASWRCGGCHSVAADRPAPSSPAPSFTDLARRFSPFDLERRLTGLPRTGHPEMPPADLQIDEALAIAAYIEALTKPPSPIAVDRNQGGRARAGARCASCP